MHVSQSAPPHHARSGISKIEVALLIVSVAIGCTYAVISIYRSREIAGNKVL